MDDLRWRTPCRTVRSLHHEVQAKIGGGIGQGFRDGELRLSGERSESEGDYSNDSFQHIVIPGEHHQCDDPERIGELCDKPAKAS